MSHVVPYQPQYLNRIGAVSSADYYSADDIIGKTLIARKKTPIYVSAFDNAISMGYVNAGQPIGVVYSWVGPKMSNDGFSRSGLWWCFVENNGMWYYTPHIEGQFDVDLIKQSGVLTVEEKAKQEAEAQKRAAMSWWEILMQDYGKPILLTGIALFAAPGIIRSLQKK